MRNVLGLYMTVVFQIFYLAVLGKLRVRVIDYVYSSRKCKIRRIKRKKNKKMHI